MGRHPTDGDTHRKYYLHPVIVSGRLEGGSEAGRGLINEGGVGGGELVSPLTLVSPAYSMASSICGHYHVNRQEWRTKGSLGPRAKGASAAPSVDS